MKRRLGYLVVGMVLSVLVAGCGATPGAPPLPTNVIAPTEQPRIPLKVATYRYVSDAPVYIAQEEGYFAEQGLDVELVDFGSSSNEIIPALVAGQLDAAAVGISTSIFNAIYQGNNLKYVADKGFLDPESCVVNAWVAGKQFLESGARANPAMIKGKRVVFAPGGPNEYSMDLLLAQNGLTPADIEPTSILQSPARVEALRNGSVAVSALAEPWITHAVTSGAGEVWVPFSALMPNFTFGTIVFGATILEDKPEAGTRFMIAYLRGVQQFNQGKTDRNVEIIADFTKTDPEEVKASCWASFKADGTIDTQGMLDFQRWGVEKGYLDGSLELDQFYDPRFVSEAARSIGN